MRGGFQPPFGSRTVTEMMPVVRHALRPWTVTNLRTPWLSPAVMITGLALLLGVLFTWALAGEHWMSLTLVIVVGLLPIFFRWPIVSTFGLYAFLLPFDTVEAAAGAMGFTRPLSVVTVGVLALAALTERRLHRPPMSAVCCGLVVLWCGVGTLWAIDSEGVLRRLPSMLSLFAVYIVATAIVPTRKELYSVAVLAVLGGACVAAIAYVYGLQYGVEGRMTLAVGGRVANPNNLAAALILPLALSIAGFLHLKAGALRILALGAVSVIATGMYISASRAALIAAGAMLLVLICRTGIKKEMVATVLILSVLAGTVSASLFERLDLLVSGEDATGSGRLDIWKIGVQGVREFGLFGAGLNNFADVYRHYSPLGPRLIGPGAHNTYLMVWVELGLPGLLLILWALGGHFAVARTARKAGRDTVALAALEAACVGMLVVSIFGDDVWSKQFWLPFILLMWAAYVPRRADDGFPHRAVYANTGSGAPAVQS